MKYFLIGFAIYFAVVWLPQFIAAWVLKIRYYFEKWKAIKNNDPEKWVYEI